MTFRKIIETACLCAFLLLFSGETALGQQHEGGPQATSEHSEDEKHQFHRNHFGGVVGLSTHHDSGESGGTLGLEYARVFSPRWAIAGYLEMVSSRLERDFIVVAAAIFYLAHNMSLILGPGLELVERDVEVHGVVEKEQELEMMVRLGVGYSFSLASNASIGPVAMIDRGKSRWTSLFGIAMAVGF